VDHVAARRDAVRLEPRLRRRHGHQFQNVVAPGTLGCGILRIPGC
jgi:hypothetical protein